MLSSVDTDSSINQLLDLFQNYRGKQWADLDFDDRTEQHCDISNILHCFSNRTEKHSDKFNFNASITKLDKHHATLKQNTIVKEKRRNIFNRLYNQNKELQAKRIKLIEEGRRSLEAKEVKECTFSPCVKFSRLKTESVCNEEDSETFYKKNIEWQQRKEKNIKIMQCEKNSRHMKDITFTPKINSSRPRSRSNENTLLKAKGVEQFLNRQIKAKTANELLQTRKKESQQQYYSLRPGYFSQLI